MCVFQELFSKCGSVQDVRIHGKNQVRPGVGGGARAPLYAFVAFDSTKGVEAALNEKVNSCPSFVFHHSYN